MKGTSGKGRAPAGAQERFVRKRAYSLKPSPENKLLYRAPQEDNDLACLADAMRRNGCDPLVITLDGYIVSGHRRHRALTEYLHQEFVRCRVLPVRRAGMDGDDYVKLLRDFNEQRDKSVAERVKEGLVDVDPDEAHRRLVLARHEALDRPRRNGLEALDIGARKNRPKISEDKAEHVRLVLQIVEELKDFWPLSIRGVHYPLLNHDFVRGVYWPKKGEPGHGRPQERRYRND